MLSVVFIGAGPHCLTTLARLLEPDADTSIDQETRRVTPKSELLRYWARQHTSKQYRAGLAAWLAEHVAVVDASGQSWLARWRQQFDGLAITHLRSPSSVHPDPLDSYALSTWTAQHGRSGEARPLKDLPKSTDYHGPFHTPSTSVFEDFVADLVVRYSLDSIILHDKVVGLVPVFEGGAAAATQARRVTPGAPLPHVSHWHVRLASGSELLARRVVVGIGSTNIPRIPEALQHLTQWTVPTGGGGADAGARNMVDACGAAADGGACSERACNNCVDVSATTHGSQGRMCTSDSVSCSSSSGGSATASLYSPLPLPEEASNQDIPPPGTYPAGALLHAWELADAIAAARREHSSGACDAVVRSGLLLPGERVVIIGGGLTSAHLAQLAAEVTMQQSACGAAAVAGGHAATADDDDDHHDSKRDLVSNGNSAPVTLLMRSDWRVKQFDVDTLYMGRHRATSLALFQQLRSFHSRIKLMREALQGGSMPPEVACGIRQLQAAGVVEVCEHADLAAIEWDWEESRWEFYLQDGALLNAHRIWLATGSVVDAASEPLLRSLLADLPVPLVAGLPAIQPSLEWARGAGLYVLGAYAALQLGPGALNLAGAKTASVLMSRALRDVVPSLPLGQTGKTNGGAATLGGSAVGTLAASESGPPSAEDGAGCFSGHGVAVQKRDQEPQQQLQQLMQRSTTHNATACAEGDNDHAQYSKECMPCTALRSRQSFVLSGIVNNVPYGAVARRMRRRAAAAGIGATLMPRCRLEALDLPSCGQECCGTCWKTVAMHTSQTRRPLHTRRPDVN